MFSLYIGIVEWPKSDVIVPLNTSGVFVCKDDSDYDAGLYWVIQFPGGSLWPYFYHDQTGVAATRGVVQTTLNNTSTLSISGSPENNNTLVYCANRWLEYTEKAALIVFGKHRYYIIQ